MLVRRDRLGGAEATMVAAIDAGVPALAAARDLAGEFHRMIRVVTPAPLRAWITRASTSMLRALGRGIAGVDRLAVQQVSRHGDRANLKSGIGIPMPVGSTAPMCRLYEN